MRESFFQGMTMIKWTENAKRWIYGQIDVRTKKNVKKQRSGEKAPSISFQYSRQETLDCGEIDQIERDKDRCALGKNIRKKIPKKL